jgi:hypothetical protein
MDIGNIMTQICSSRFTSDQFHFVPLAHILHVRVHYGTAFAGTVISLVGFAVISNVHRLLCFGGAMAAAMWLSGWYTVRNADRIAASAVQAK